MQEGNSIIFRQLFDRETSTYTYLVGDPSTRQAALIDPVAQQVERDLGLVEELGLKLTRVLDTHVHADHVTGSGRLRERTGAKTVAAAVAGVQCADIMVADGDRVPVGAIDIEVRSTPGHTAGCLSFVVRDREHTRVFTGDALLIRGSGRTDFQSGDAATLYRSVHDRLFTLPDQTLVYPGHDYRGRTCSTIGEEKAFNPRLRRGIDQGQFVRIMDELDLPNPQQMDVAVPANLACGKPSTPSAGRV